MIKAAVHHLSKDGVGKKIGYVHLSNTQDGLLVEPDLKELPPGFRGFHVHQFGDVEPKDGKPGGMAGQHFDPEDTGQHLGPYKDGHLGDLPRLKVDLDGTATTPVLAPRLELDDVAGRALIIHSGGDNYSDSPVVNGGGKSRIAGGIITNDCPYCKAKSEKVMLALGAVAVGYLLLK